MARIEIHRGEDVVVVDAEEPVADLAALARDLMPEVAPRPPGGAVGFHTERRPERDYEVPPVHLRSDHA